MAGVITRGTTGQWLAGVRRMLSFFVAELHLDQAENFEAHLTPALAEPYRNKFSGEDPFP
uniref:Uncharacterized protein n=1 Tax=Phyllostachys edulis TaxID=38705 RepID=D3IVP7_PHYED|nr:hypothetical protein [Phyllostachys edulis]